MTNNENTKAEIVNNVSTSVFVKEDNTEFTQHTKYGFSNYQRRGYIK